MRISPIAITIHLDLHYKFEEVQKYILEYALKDVFQPIYQVKHDQKLEPFESEELDKHLRVTTIDVEKYNSIKFEPKVEIYKNQKGCQKTLRLAGAFKINTIASKSINIFNFLMPTIGEKGGQLTLEFMDLDPALFVNLVYYESEFSKEPVFYVVLNASQGLWGNRHKWLEGIIEIIETQLKDDVLAKEWESDKKVIEELKEWSRKIKQQETKYLLLEETRQKVWNTARGIREKFSEDENAIYISPKISPRIDRQFDMKVYRKGKLPRDVGNIPEDYWYKLAWHECFDWYAPEVLKNRAISYWSNHGDDEEFLNVISIGAIGWKGTWPTVVDIMTKRPETREMIERICSFTADINWPGAGKAYEHLLNVVGMRAIPILEENIALAKEQGDEWWEDLEWLKEDILEKYGKRKK